MGKRFLSVFLVVILAFSGNGITAVASENGIEEAQYPEEQSAENNTEEKIHEEKIESVLETESAEEIESTSETEAAEKTESTSETKETENTENESETEKTENTSVPESTSIIESTEETENISEEEETTLEETENASAEVKEETETSATDKTIAEEETKTEQETQTEEESTAEDEEGDAEVVTEWPKTSWSQPGVGFISAHKDKSWIIKGDYSVDGSALLYGSRNTITIEGDLTVNGEIVIGDNYLDYSDNALVVKGNLIVNGSILFTGHKNTITVEGDSEINNGAIELSRIAGSNSTYPVNFNNVFITNGSISLNDGYLTVYEQNRMLVKGNFIQNGGTIGHSIYESGYINIEGNFEQNGGKNTLDNGEFNVGGNFTIGEKGELVDGKRLAKSSGYTLLKGGQKLNIEGNMTVCSSNGLFSPTNTYTETTLITLKGDLYQYGNSSENEVIDSDNRYARAENFKCPVNFSGEQEQIIYMESADSRIIEISATNKQLYYASPSVSFANLVSDIVINMKEDEQFREIALQHDLNLNGKKLIINGNVNHQSGCISFGYDSTERKAGEMLVTGDYIMGEQGDIEGDYMRATSSGCFSFKSSSSYGNSILDIGGNLTVCTNKSSNLSNGTVKLRGDLRQYGTYQTANSDKYAYAGAFCPANIIFCGDVPQKIYLDSAQSYFKTASFENKEIILEGDINNLTLGSDAKFTLSDAVLGRQPEFIGTLNINRHEFTIAGNYTQTAGNFKINHGVLKINGDYAIGQPGELVVGYRQKTSTGTLVMDAAEDFVYIDGSFTICSNARSTLKDGFMYIKGDFSQYGNYRSSSDDRYALPNNFAATGKHKVILNGSTPQKVFFESNESYFSVLELMQSRSKYEFSRPDCYNEIIYNEAATVAPIADCIYTGEAVIPEVRILFDDAELTEGIDYELSFSNNINAASKDSENPPTVNITYRNGNKGETSAFFTILPREMTDEEIVVQVADMEYTGTPLMPEPSVTYKGTSLIKDVDYIVSYEDNTDGGMAAVLITGQGNFTGTVKAMFEVILPEEQRKPINGATAAKISDRSYTGAGIEPKVELYDGEKLLCEYKDYKLTYFDNIEAGRAAVIVHGIGGYTGITSVPFVIKQRMLNETDVTIEPIADQTFMGTAVKPQVVVKAEGNTLKAGRDYTVSYANNVKVTSAKAATVTIKGKGSCKGNRKVSFIILPASLDVTQNEDLSINVADAAYNKGKAVKAAVTITDGSYQLKVNRDYTLSYQNNTQVSEADGVKAPTVTITGKGNYAGSMTTRNFRIYKSVMSKIKVSKIAAQTYTGTRIKPQVAVTLNNQTLQENVHYTVSYGTNINAGKGEVYITGKGTYGGTKKVTFTIKKKPLSDGVILSPIESAVYTGNVQTPSVTAYDGKKLLREDRDYTVKYTNNKNAGSAAKATLTGRGNYSGKISGTFLITPASLLKENHPDLNILVSDAVYKNGKAVKPVIVVSDGNVILKEKRDYTILCMNNTQLSDGTGTNAPQVVITGKGNYAADSVTRTFRICTGNIASVKVPKVSNQNYTGLQIRPTVTVTEKKTGALLTEGVDYTLEYGENRRTGTGYIYIKGAGTYGGLKTIKFKIV